MLIFYITFATITVVLVVKIIYQLGYNAGLKKADSMIVEKFPWLSETDRH